MNAYIKFGEIVSIFSQDIKWKQNFGVNQGPYSGKMREKQQLTNSSKILSISMHTQKMKIYLFVLKILSENKTMTECRTTDNPNPE